MNRLADFLIALVLVAAMAWSAWMVGVEIERLLR